MKAKNKDLLNNSRRKFVKSISTFAGVFPFVYGGEVSLNKRDDVLRHACIGVGGMGGHDLQQFLSHPKIKITAICDVDKERLEEASKKVPEAMVYTDWRELLRNEAKNIDSVNVSVPDHMHFAIAYEFIKADKHVYCQKPMCHDVKEVRVLTELAEASGVVTQLGTQHASGMGDRTAVELLKDGVIGKIEHAYLCSNRPGATEHYRLEGPRPPERETPPTSLNWDLWIGTAPMRDYAPEIYHPTKWRAWQDFGTGWSGDIGCHIFDAVWKGLKLAAPLSVRAKVQKSWKELQSRRNDTWPQSNHITWIFPGNEFTHKSKLTVEWFDGEFYPPKNIRKLYSIEDYPAESAMLIGTKGALLIPHGKMPVLLPEREFKEVRLPSFEERNHYHHFVDACIGKFLPESHFGISGPMSETVILGTVAIRIPNKTLQWDSQSMEFTNNTKANKLLSRIYRTGWEIDGF